MKHLFFFFALSLVLFACSEAPEQISHHTAEETSRTDRSLGPQNFNEGWLFFEGDSKDFVAADFDDSAWQNVRLPHDWSVAHPFDEKWDGATAYLPGGLGWYRKRFKSTSDANDTLTFINFDGIYNHSSVYINGKKIGGEVNGYTPFTLDLTAYLNPVGEDNIIAVRVDRTRYIDSRWYPGSGIYRNVHLYQKPKLHIPVWGTYLTTPNISAEAGLAELTVTLHNREDAENTTLLRTRVLNAKGEEVAKHEEAVSVPARGEAEFTQNLRIDSPELWGIASPYLYSVVTELLSDGQTVDKITTPLGFRTIEYKPDSGFYLNGEHTLIKGVNIHHEAGLVGAAVPEDVWRRRLLTLKEAGVNAIRMAHNPASRELMALCDELGLLVQAEIFDEWDYPKDKRLNQQERHDDYISRGYADWFQTHAEKDLKAAVMRDRNHPSLIMWSIGNEIEWTYPRYAAATGYFDMNAGGNYFFNPPFISPEEIKQRFETSEEGEYVLAKTAQKLSAWVKELDTTRPVVANMILPSVSHISGYTDALDIVGYSYRRVIYDYGRRLFPEKMIMGTENVVQWHEWKAVLDREFIAGTFLWTGIDYLGEAHGGWPRKGVASGMLDLAGFKKPSFHMFKSLWNDEPNVYLTTQALDKSVYTLDKDGKVVEKEPGSWEKRVWYWHDVQGHWNYKDGESTVVEAYSNCDSLELFLNGTSYGKQNLADHPDRVYKWSVPFTSGKLEAKGDCGVSNSVVTAMAPTTLLVDTDKTAITIDEKTVSHIEVQLSDKDGNPVSHQESTLTFIVPDGLRLLGVDNGWVNSVQDYQADSVKTYLGRALGIVVGEKVGTYEIKVISEAGGEASIAVEVIW
ncbi:glycoside hydrolase family 2 TIM barrel-domain containing protein [Agaribacter flavus]|uniref:Glycoside hydrolase family 2 TIM barrel-domain containing protein n=1 Tax=Agaribacter flavus TaxID=1902781 RepID=A0ABV7FPL6_9ALTE